MPVSRTVNCNSFLALPFLTVRTTSPFSVNLTALLKQVDEDLAQAGDIALDACRDIVVDDVGDVESFFDGAAGRQVQCQFDTFAQVEGLEFHIHLACFDLAEVQDVVDDGQQGIARVADGLGVVALFLVEFRIHQQTAHADDRVHRRADLVTHGGKEGTLGFVGCFGGSLRRLCFIE